jgi:transcriptional regulator with XRE-family HTH domain
MKPNVRFSERLRETLRAKGYWDAERGAPEVGRFCVDYGYLPSYLYRWLRGEVPRAEKLLVLAKQLDVKADWLVGVEEAPRRRPHHPIAGGSSDDGTLPLANLAEILPLIGSWLRQWVWPLHSSWAWA